MSVPLPSPSPIEPSAAKSIPRSRPQAIATPGGPGSLGRSPGRPLAHSPASPHSPRSPSVRKSASKTVGFGASASGEDNWRERSSAPKSAVRTVGGFEKKGSGSPTSSGPIKDVKKVEEKDADGKPALSHVPCRFYKAGACTAGSSCPFSHEEGGKREICQWFLKGNCKFGHKCALAHVRPGEPMSMDRKNKKASQLEARGEGKPVPAKSDAQLTPSNSAADIVTTPVPIRSALSSSIQSPPAHRAASSPLREPFGPPSSGPVGGTSPGFARSPIPPNFASSPSRPSPLSGSFSARQTAPGGMGPRSGSMHSPLRPPVSAFSSSFSHSTLREIRPGTSPIAPPLSASFADGSRKNIWARSETSADQPEVLSPRRPIITKPSLSSEHVFDELEDDDHGEDLLPSSLSDLLTPRERARRMSRRDSNESFSASPSRNAFGPWANGERLAQSAGPTMGPGFLQNLWSEEGADARKTANGDPRYGSVNAAGPQHQSLLTAQRSPVAAHGTYPISNEIEPHASGSLYPIRALGDPSSPSARALQEHAPGQSLPGGIASALSRLHLHGPKMSSGLAQMTPEHSEEKTPESTPAQLPGSAGRREDHEEEALFTMDG